MSEGEVKAIISTGASAGLTFRYEGGEVISTGSERKDLNKAACTSTAAASILREGSNSRVNEVEPNVLVDEIDIRPAMVENCFSSGSATEEAIVSGAAPGRLAETLITGVLYEGRAATGILLHAASPAITSATFSSTVITGRRMNSSVIFIWRFPKPLLKPPAWLPQPQPD